MSDQFVAEIRIFSGNFAILGWAQCDGQLLPISQNTALFSLIGTYYGGNGTSNFALPDLRGRSPIGPGQGAGLSNYVIGQVGGTESVTVLSTEMPAHTHAAQAYDAAGTQDSAVNAVWARSGAGRGKNTYAPSATLPATTSLGVAGGNQPHENRSPYLGLNFIIALTGIFPSRA